jgi:hypothetical protein
MVAPSFLGRNNRSGDDGAVRAQTPEVACRCRPSGNKLRNIYTLFTDTGKILPGVRRVLFYPSSARNR